MAPPPHEEDDAEVSCSKLSDREFYTIPASSSEHHHPLLLSFRVFSDVFFVCFVVGWFQWDEIHETERRSIPEFFDGSSVSKNPRVYKEYRDFIISKYREEPSRRLTFTEVRKSLIGDVGALHRVFLFLDGWGLINFGVPAVEARDDGCTAVTVSSVVEEGVPAGLRIVPASAVAGGTQGSTAGGESVFRLPPLTSYTDAFGDWVPGKGPVCGVCGNHCQHGQYEKTMVTLLNWYPSLCFCVVCHEFVLRFNRRTREVEFQSL